MLAVTHKLNDPLFAFSTAMVSAKQLADFGYKAFSSSMILLTLYGGYLCGVRTYYYFQRKSIVEPVHEEEQVHADAIKN